MGTCCQAQKRSYRGRPSMQETKLYDPKFSCKLIFPDRSSRTKETTTSGQTYDTNKIMGGTRQEGLVKMVAKRDLIEIEKEEMTKKMHRFIGAVWCCEGQGKVRRASGFLISPNLVLTSAHLIYDHETQKQYSNIRFLPGVCGNMTKYVTVSQYFLPVEYINKPSTITDFAVLKLEKEVMLQSFMELAVAPEAVDKFNLAICGYPRSKYKKVAREKGVYQISQWGDIGKNKVRAVRAEQAELLHELSVKNGQEGSPIICFSDSGEMMIVGMQRGAIKEGNECINLGMLFCDRIVNTIEDQARRMGARLPKIQRNVEENQIRISFKSQKQKTKSQEYIQKGLQQFTQKKYEYALIFFKMAVDLNPQDLQAQYHMANTLKQMNHPKQARKGYMDIIQLGSGYVKAYINLGAELIRNKQYTEAINCLGKGLTIDQYNIELYCLLGNAQYRTRNMENAKKCYEKVIELNPRHSQALNGLGQIIRHQKGWKYGINYFRKAIQADKNNQLAIFNLSIDLYYSKLPQQSLQLFSTLLPLMKTSEKATINIEQIILEARSVTELEYLMTYMEFIESRKNDEVVQRLLQLIRKEIRLFNSDSDSFFSV